MAPSSVPQLFLIRKCLSDSDKPLTDGFASAATGAVRLGEVDGSGNREAIAAVKPTAAQVKATVRATQAAVKAQLKKDKQTKAEKLKNLGKPTEAQVKYAKKLGTLKADVKEKEKRKDVSGAPSFAFACCVQ